MGLLSRIFGKTKLATGPDGKVACKKCGGRILPRTARKYKGLCFPCASGDDVTIERIRNNKAVNDRLKRLGDVKASNISSRNDSLKKTKETKKILENEDIKNDFIEDNNKSKDEIITKSRNCDKCNCLLSPPKGYLLDIQQEGLDLWKKLTNFGDAAKNYGAIGVTKQSDPFWFVCESCLSLSAESSGIKMDSCFKQISSNRAKHFWKTGEWERPMHSSDYLPNSDEKFLPWMSSELEKQFMNDFGPEPTLEDYNSIRSNLLCRILAQNVHEFKPFKNTYANNPQKYVIVLSEMKTDMSWDKYLVGFIQRRLLEYISTTTKVFFISYNEEVKKWFSYRMLPYVATSIAIVLSQNSAEVKYECCINNKGHRSLIVRG